MILRTLIGHRMPKPVQYFLLLLLICGFLTGCSHWRESYFNSAIDDATQEQVEAKLGKPWRTKTSLLNGETIWIYRYTLTSGDLDPMGVNTLGQSVSAAANSAASLIGKGDSKLVTDKPQCFHYLLTFHESKMLKSWLREPCADTAL